MKCVSFIISVAKSSVKAVTKKANKIQPTTAAAAIEQLEMNIEEIQYVCEFCSKPFKKEKYLNAHQKSMHDAFLLKFNCSTCSKTFSSKYSFKYHCKNEHNWTLTEEDLGKCSESKKNTKRGK